MKLYIYCITLVLLTTLTNCSQKTENTSDNQTVLKDSLLIYEEYIAKGDEIILSRGKYVDQLYGFWLGQCIANWTGLITEMDKIGGEGINGRAAGFYTRDNWGGPDHPNLWSIDNLNALSDTIDFYFEDEGEVWGADDDTDIEYMYQYITYNNKYIVSKLSAEQIRDGWLKHIYSDDNTPHKTGNGQPENFLWVSNQTAHDLMREGVLPPETSAPDKNPNYEMIDAQLTTEIFGFFAPGRPDVALDLAYLPIRTTARENAAWISEFYVVMYSLASVVDTTMSRKEQVFWLAEEASKRLPIDSYSASMYDFIKAKYEDGIPWEAARDSLYQKYQVRNEDGYVEPTKEPGCHGCFAAGINFGASLVSLFYGEGDIKETIKIGALAGWDSDNPTATWGGLLGFMLGKEGVEDAFGRKFASKFNIHRTRTGFKNGIDTFENMASTGVFVVDRVVQEQLNGGIDLENDNWFIPKFNQNN